MIGLSTAEIAQIRASILEMLPDTCDILAVTLTSDGAGGVSETWGTVTGGSAVPCRLDFRDAGKEAVQNAAITPYKSGILSIAYDEPITNANRIQIASQAYNVTGVNVNQSWLVVQQVNVERVP
jgi:head-tail adaptor